MVTLKFGVWTRPACRGLLSGQTAPLNWINCILMIWVSDDLWMKQHGVLNTFVRYKSASNTVHRNFQRISENCVRQSQVRLQKARLSDTQELPQQGLPNAPTPYPRFMLFYSNWLHQYHKFDQFLKVNQFTSSAKLSERVPRSRLPLWRFSQLHFW